MSTGKILVVGAGRGIGAELVRQYLAEGWTVHATVRDRESPGELAGLEGDLVVHQLDVRDAVGTAGLAAELVEAGLAIAVHNAGIYRGHPRQEVMEVNAVAPIRMAEALLDANAIAAGGVLALMTSQLGSRRGSTGSLGDYGDSKAALNDELRRRAGTWAEKGIIAVVVHPGWVQTDMGGAAAPLRVEESVGGMRRLFASLGPEHHGRFWAWDGRELPW
jgi:NAD(P)-dependent dehydrogenase (short-subunit alcohol dehydrogenase family)